MKCGLTPLAHSMAGVSVFPLVPAPHLLLPNLIEENLFLFLIELSQQVGLYIHILKNLSHHPGGAVMDSVKADFRVFFLSSLQLFWCECLSLQTLRSVSHYLYLLLNRLQWPRRARDLKHFWVWHNCCKHVPLFLYLAVCLPALHFTATCLRLFQNSWVLVSFSTAHFQHCFCSRV